MHEHTFPPFPRRARGAERRIVLKIGTRILTEGTDRLSERRCREIAEHVVGIPGTEVVIVSSGAVAAGFRALGYATPPKGVQERQAAAAVGQTHLMSLWQRVFEPLGRPVAQVLLTNDCLTDRRRYVTARGAFAELLERKVVPIVNENDTVSVDEIMVGDNDNLAAMTAALVDAHLLILLTDVPGVFAARPANGQAPEPIRHASSARELAGHVYRKTSAESRGGMETKLQAAEKAGRYGIPTVITSGSDPEALQAALRGEPTGTYIAAEAEPLPALEHWMAVQRRPHGAVVVDDGALAAIRRSASLLPRGVVAVHGTFRKGDLVSVVDRHGVEHARGIVRFDDREVERIRGLHSSEVANTLDQPGASVVMRPDRMLILEGAR